MYTLIPGCIILVATIILLVKRYDTRATLIGAGILLCLVSGSPMEAFDAFTTRMTTAGLIESICSSMGFAYVMKYTECDLCLVRLLTRGLSNIGFLLLPVAVTITFFICIAIPSAAGVSAAVGATLIPLLIAARIHPAIAGGAVLSGTLGAYLNPGVAHNAFVSNISHTPLMDFVFFHAPFTISCGIICAVSLTVVAIFMKDLNYLGESAEVATEKNDEVPGRNIRFCLQTIAPFLPVILLVASGIGWLGHIKMNVPAAMIIGSVYALLITRSSPGLLTRSFFDGMGAAYASILGIIIAAAVFIGGLNAAGIIQAFINLLTSYPEFARWGGTLGPFLMGLITGTGDATAFAFNEAVTPHAANFGFEINHLGAGVMLSSALGRNMSPLAGATIVCAGIAGVSPLEIVKRTAPGAILSVLFVAIVFL
ncbi:anaerobic C4-dicarboxylate transporter DcuC [Salmonella enterica]|uniref:C4-dicarboxylate transporter DcuC n=1 Tax=Salmonella enterica TaxID=28901 RepID=UPI0008FC3AA8|nr:C4-dicarboxylate transporter DcuC [Salmonella enterica]EBR8649407.1 C4-dicarboxylate ABC transporter [Salmonella enterica subsp. enterica serovar Muenchen]EED3952328.1 TRAP transporter large permease subunit [Salmonella enterica subsp. enterica serovar Newport]EAA8358265.1 TRAP transporter large permease subunit [Salmonella enterica subsp. enterica serovar Poona]EAP4203184.1 TRAP transporter large permease subunit [Salmonella enterica subsp. enterica serovar Poona]EAR0439515.1 TRAP transpor